MNDYPAIHLLSLVLQVPVTSVRGARSRVDDIDAVADGVASVKAPTDAINLFFIKFCQLFAQMVLISQTRLKELWHQVKSGMWNVAILAAFIIVGVGWLILLGWLFSLLL
jgi:HAMP domain-containing protein